MVPNPGSLACLKRSITLMWLYWFWVRASLGTSAQHSHTLSHFVGSASVKLTPRRFWLSHCGVRHAEQCLLPIISTILNTMGKKCVTESMQQYVSGWEKLVLADLHRFGHFFIVSVDGHLQTSQAVLTFWNCCFHLLYLFSLRWG